MVGFAAGLRLCDTEESKTAAVVMSEASGRYRCAVQGCVA